MKRYTADTYEEAVARTERDPNTTPEDFGAAGLHFRTRALLKHEAFAGLTVQNALYATIHDNAPPPELESALLDAVYQLAKDLILHPLTHAQHLHETGHRLGLWQQNEIFDGTIPPSVEMEGTGYTENGLIVSSMLLTLLQRDVHQARVAHDEAE